MNEKLIVILNPKSGSSGPDFRRDIETALQSRGAEYEIRLTTLEISGGQLAQEAIVEGAIHLVACGGDGTVMSVVNGVGKSDRRLQERPQTTKKQNESAEGETQNSKTGDEASANTSNADNANSDNANEEEASANKANAADAKSSDAKSNDESAPSSTASKDSKTQDEKARDEGEEKEDMPSVTLSIVPGGTANLLAQALGIPTDVESAVACVVAGEDRVIDLGRCGEYLFALGLGIGLTERLVSQASTQAKEKIGRLAYVVAMLKELGAKPHTFTLKRDDKRSHRKRGVAVVIANAGEIGGKMKFAPDALMDDGLLDVCILHRFFLRDVFRMMWSTLIGDIRQDRAISFYQARHIELGSNPPLDLQIDGEVVDLTTPLVVDVVPRALRVRVPAKEKEAATELKK
jgi:YegS/Rv2252/BmrU family lipid kinase